MSAVNESHRIETPGAVDKAREHLPPAPDEYGLRERTPSFNETDHVQATLRTDAAIATGHALLAIHQELAALRAETAGDRVAVCRELADVAAAVRDLAAAITSAAAPVAAAVDHLDVIAAGVDQAASANEGLADVAAAVDALAGDLRPRRRSWRDRFRRRFDTEAGEVPA
jgi:hypothetical protein